MKTNRTEHGRKANWQLKRRGKANRKRTPMKAKFTDTRTVTC